MNLIKLIEEKEKKNFKINFKISTGDIIQIETIDEKKKIQNFIGLIISIKNKGINSSFKIQKFSNEIKIEKTIPLYSPIIKSVKILNKIKKKKSKLYYLKKKNKKFNN